MEIRLKLPGPTLWTRERARVERAKVEAALGRIRPGDTLVIDMSQVEAFDFSFANEYFGKTLLSLKLDHPGRFVIVENVLDYARENLSKAMEGLNMVMIERRGSELVLLGKAHATDEATFEAVRRAKAPVTASALSNQLGVNVTAANERLTKLTNLAVVRREKSVSPAGREQYVYTVLA